MTPTTRKALNLIVAGFCVAGIVQSALAQDKRRPDSLESRIERLEQTISILERRIADLENAQQPHQAVAPARGKWRQLRQGMPAEEVRRLFGEPLKVEVNPLHIHTYWYYSPAGMGGPHVLFSSSSMPVNGWQEP